MRKVYLGLLVFWGGLVSLGGELAASRLLAPYFGTSLIVWTNLIGLILIYLSAGYWLGGRWADRSPHLTTILTITTLAGTALALVPFIATPVLQLSIRGFAEFEAGLLIGSFVGVLVLFAVPMVLLGCISPFAIRLATETVEHSGRVAGQIYALSTLGSVIGTFLPVLILIPSWGTRNTFIFFGVTLLLTTAVGFVLARRLRLAAVPAMLLAAILAFTWYSESGAIKPTAGLIYETESRYQYIRVVEDEHGWRELELNEGIGVHSKYHPDTPYTGGVWDFFALVPFFNPAPYEPAAQANKWAVIGSAAGTAPRAISAIYGPVEIDGAEIDPKVVRVGRRYFDMNLPKFDVDVQDGRAWLLLNDETYDVMLVDAYRQPYIPFELTTVEFFEQVRRHLHDPGVVAINVGRGPSERRLVDALATTMAAVYPSVFVMDMDHSYNTFVVATTQPATVADFHKNVAGTDHPVLTQLYERIDQNVGVPALTGTVLTDDRAPVERMIDLMIVRAAVTGEVQ